jgi:hypothetical protein
MISEDELKEQAKKWFDSAKPEPCIFCNQPIIVAWNRWQQVCYDCGQQRVKA